MQYDSLPLSATGNRGEKQRRTAVGSGPDMFLGEHSIDEIDDILALSGSGVGGTGAVQVAGAADQQFETDLVPFHFDTDVERAALPVLELERGQQVGRERQPVETDHRPLLKVSLEVGIYIVSFHRRQFIDNNLAHRLFRGS
jgi:hypothetical protein